MCAPSDIFVDDFFTYGEGSDAIAPIVIDEFANEVAQSTITFDGRWARDAFEGCEPLDDPNSPVDLPLGSRYYVSGPVFPAAEAEAQTMCVADVIVSLRSEYLGEVTGAPQGMLGLYAGEGWRGPQQDLP